jgi:alpha/beta superfamily hydrolase
MHKEMPLRVLRNSVFSLPCDTLAFLFIPYMSAQHESRNLFLTGPAGRLEAILWSPSAGTTPMAAVVCHPHPLFGGTMHNKVVYQAAKSLDAFGLPLLRFNFRGTGTSEGKHDRGEGERGDVRAALDFLAAEFPNIPLLVAGFSFGCWVGLRVGCEDARVTSLIGLGAPVNNADFSYLAKCVKPKLFVHGANDIYGAVDKVKSLVASLPGENKIVIVENADHFFVGKLDQVDRAIAEWMVHRLPH